MSEDKREITLNNCDWERMKLGTQVTIVKTDNGLDGMHGHPSLSSILVAVLIVTRRMLSSVVS